MQLGHFEKIHAACPKNGQACVINALPHPLRQILRPEMSVPLQHLQCLVAGDGADLHGVEAFFKEAAGEPYLVLVIPKSLQPSVSMFIRSPC